MHAYSQFPEDILFTRTQKLKAQGIDPYPENFTRTHSLYEVAEDYLRIGSDYEGEIVALSLCGRVMEIDQADKIIITIEDQDARLRLALDPAYLDSKQIASFWSNVYRGDYLGFEVDYVYREQDLITARVTKWQFLALCLLPLPRRIDSQEWKYRQRYAHLEANLDARDRFRIRSKILHYLRRFLEDKHDFMEVNTPLLQPQDAAGRDLILRISAERYLERLLIGGFERVYEIIQTFSDEPVDWQTYSETQILQYCMTPASLDDMIRLTEHMIVDLTVQLNATRVIPWKPLEQLRAIAQQREQDEIASDDTSSLDAAFDFEDIQIDLVPPWSRRSVYELVQDQTGINFARICTISDAITAAHLLGVDPPDGANFKDVHEVLIEIIRQIVGPSLIQPTFLVDSPAKDHTGSPQKGKHFQLYINGLIFAEGFSGLTDPQERETLNQDDDLLAALKYGLPPSSGVSVYIDRIVMLMTGATDIRDVIYFPVFHPSK